VGARLDSLFHFSPLNSPFSLPRASGSTLRPHPPPPPLPRTPPVLTSCGCVWSGSTSTGARTRRRHSGWWLAGGGIPTKVLWRVVLGDRRGGGSPTSAEAVQVRPADERMSGLANSACSRTHSRFCGAYNSRPAKPTRRPVPPNLRYLTPPWPARLPRTGCIVFTIRTYMQPVQQAVHGRPLVAAALAGALRDLPYEHLEYKSNLQKRMPALLQMLDAAAAAAPAAAEGEQRTSERGAAVAAALS
jgi:hypothetical protein